MSNCVNIQGCRSQTG